MVTVIIPVKNRFDELRETLKSVENQTHLPARIILVDDSTELGLVELISEFPNLKIEAYPNPNEWIHGARQFGLSKATTPYIAFLDSDDIWLPVFLEASLKVLEKNKNFIGTLCLSNLIFSDSFSTLGKIKITLLTFLKNFSLICSYVLYSKKLYSSASYFTQFSHMIFKNKNLPDFETKWRSAEDWLFCFNVQQSGPIGILPKRLTYYRFSEKGTTLQMKNKGTRAQTIYHKLFIDYVEKKLGPTFFMTLLKIYYLFFIKE